MINITPSSQITKIYLVTNCYGDPNKVYIGQTRTCRKSAHKKTYGRDINYDYIDEIYSWDHKDWKPLETFWIRQFKNFGFEVLNSNEGGGGPQFYSEESKLKMSKSRKGITLSQETRDKISQSSTGRKCSDESKFKMSLSGMGKIITQETKDKIGLSNKGKSKPEGFGDSVKNRLLGTKRSKESTDKMVIKLNKPVTQVDINGNIVENFNSIINASKATGILTGSISDCLKGKIPSTGKDKFRFFYTKDIKVDKFPPLSFKYKVYYNNTITECNSLKEIIKTGISQRGIYKCFENRDGIYKTYKIIINETNK